MPDRPEPPASIDPDDRQARARALVAERLVQADHGDPHDLGAVEAWLATLDFDPIARLPAQIEILRVLGPGQDDAGMDRPNR